MKKGFSIVWLIVVIVVVAGGILAWQLWPKNEFADWKTYQSQQDGYEFKYPSDWSINAPTNDYVILTPPGKKINSGDFDEIKILLVQNDELRQWRQEQLKLDKPGPENVKGITVGAENYKAIELKGLGLIVSKDIFLEKDSLTYHFSINEESSKMPIFNQILSTFKFTGKDETADWKTYRNDGLGFELKYPITWDNYLTVKNFSENQVIFYLPAYANPDNKNLGTIDGQIFCIGRKTISQ